MNIKKFRLDNALQALFVIVASVGASFGLTRLLFNYTVEPDYWKIRNFYIQPDYEFRPEPNETLGFMFFVCATAIFSLLFAFLYNRLIQKRLSNRAKVICAVPLFLVAVYALVSLFRTLFFYDGFYLQLTSIWLKPALPLCVLAAALCLYWLYRKKESKLAPWQAKNGETSRKIFRALAIIAIVFLSFLHMQTNLTAYAGHHLAVTLEPIEVVKAGGTIGIDIHSLYGYYAYFIYYMQMFFFGRISVFGTIFCFSALMAITNVLIYFIVIKITKSEILGLISTLAIIFGCQLIQILINGETYYQYFPIRLILTVFMLFFLVSHYYANERMRKVYAALAAVQCGLGLLWNPETGMMCIVLYAAYYIYLTVVAHPINSKWFWINLVKYALYAVASILLWYLLLQLVTYTRCGQMLSVRDMFWGILVFGGEGFFMLPLPESHPYLIVLLIYAVALAKSLCGLRLWKTKDAGQTADSADHTILFVLSATGFSTFFYFLGRSHHYNLCGVIWPAYLLLTYYLRMFVTTLNETSQKMDTLTKVTFATTKAFRSFIALAACFLLAVSSTSLFTMKLNDNWHGYANRRTICGTESVPDYDFMNFVDAHTEPGERVAIVDTIAPVYSAELGLKNDFFGVAITDLVFLQDYYDILESIRKYQGKVFIANDLVEVELKDGTNFGEEFDAMMEANFDLQDSIDGARYYTSKTNRGAQ